MSSLAEQARLLTEEEVAERVGVSLEWTRGLIELGLLPPPTAPQLYDPAELEDWIAEAGGREELRKHVAKLAQLERDPLVQRMRAGFRRLEALRDELAIEREGRDSELQRVYDELAQTKDRLAKAQAGRAPQRDKLVELALAGDVELAHWDGEAYATVPVNGHVETVKLRTRAFRRWLGSRYYAETKGTAGGEGLNDAIMQIEARALEEGVERPAHVRLAEHAGCIYLDLARPDWRVVEISADGWRVLDPADAPVRFVRPRGVRALPEPKAGGKLEWLKRYVNVKDADLVLVYAWLVAAFRPSGPFPVLALSAEQGSGKSTLTRVLRKLVDPNAAEISTLPREERDLMVAAKNSWCLALDNVSTIPPWLADAICRLATGGGFRARQLHTDDEETLFEAQRPQILNGLGELAARPDLGDRALVVRLPTIPDDAREPESTMWSDFDEDWPLLLGAILDAVVGALSRIETTQLERIPRMADFALWAQAAEPSLPVPPGSFMDAYDDNRAGLSQAAVEDDVFVAELYAFARDQGTWEGTATELLAAVKARMSEDTVKLRNVPKRPNEVGTRIRRYAPALRASGVTVETDQESASKGGRKIIRITVQ